MKKTPFKPRKKALARGGPIRKKQRTAAERERIYGPRGRAKFVKSMPCANCGLWSSPWTTIVNAHIKTGGTGRKADYLDIIPLCSTETKQGCHDAQHALGWSALPRLDTPAKRRRAARITELSWQDRQSYVRSRQGRRKTA